jgi:hypothetical protein
MWEVLTRLDRQLDLRIFNDGMSHNQDDAGLGVYMGGEGSPKLVRVGTDF